MDMFGKLLRQWDLAALGYTFHHEVAEAQNGNFLVTVSKSSARLANGKPRINDFIIELNPVNGTVAHEWDLATMADTARYPKLTDGSTPGPFAQSPGNWAHNNSVAEHLGNLLITMRYQGIASFTPGGALKWLISPHKNWGAKYQRYLLKPVDESGQAVTDAAVVNGEAAAEGFDWAWGRIHRLACPTVIYSCSITDTTASSSPTRRHRTLAARSNTKSTKRKEPFSRYGNTVRAAAPRDSRRRFPACSTCHPPGMCSSAPAWACPRPMASAAVWWK